MPPLTKTDLQIPLAAPTCGNCKWGKPADEEHVACFGHPPTPVLMGVTQDRWQRPNPQFMNMRAVLANAEPACRVFEKRAVPILGPDGERAN